MPAAEGPRTSSAESGPGRSSTAKLVALDARPLTIPLLEPFVIATAQLDSTRAALVTATLQDESGNRAQGYGEAAAFPPVTVEDQPELLAALARAAHELVDLPVPALDEALVARLSATVSSPVARAGVEAAIADAWARLDGRSLARALQGSPGAESATARPLFQLETDITLPISHPDHMAELAARYRREGFTCFKVKVGRRWDHDCASLRAVAAAVRDARFRLDANAGFSARDALALLEGVMSDGLHVECYEQPCARDDLTAMAAVSARSPVPVVADESFHGAGDLVALANAKAAHAVNLKLAKLGGPVAAFALARQARAAGFQLMAGAMVESRLGLLAMAHVVAALDGVDWVDLDTSLLLADDPFAGGWSTRGPAITLDDQPGLGVEPWLSP